ncbi:MAG: cob(I)yrinic acid a,c-diamide adenosyltransferase [Methylocystaceae bacterium]|nr:cob(I)yrinic acid a,c-diamide adenosyltransferase [Methylocystaceae bacterium]
MVTLTKIYTRGGDNGETSLGDGTRIAKYDLRVDAYGSVDETNATIGLARIHTDGEADQMLERIQNDLFDLGADLCTPQTGRKNEGALRIVSEQVDRLESEIDFMNDQLSDLTSFILPGGSPASAYLHLSRTICRRAERLCSQLADREEINPLCVQYLNRLSDHAFVMARFLNDKGKSDILWKPGAHR